MSVNPQEEYLKRKEHFTKIFNRQKKFFTRLSNLRILVFILGIGGSIYLFFLQQYRLSGAFFIVSFILFLFLIIKHEKIRQEKNRTFHLIEVNQTSLDRLAGKWTQFPVDGKEFIDSDHSYSLDLDIFGQGSLFQWINTTNTYFGKLSLKDLLTHLDKERAQIRKRQQAIAELAEKLDWRQRFQVEGMFSQTRTNNPARLINWAEKKEKMFDKSWKVYLLCFLPVTTVILAFLAFTMPEVPNSTPLIPLLIQLVIIAYGYKKINHIFDATCNYKKVIKIYQCQLMLLESAKFKSKYLNDLKSDLFNRKGHLASIQIKNLGKIVDMMELRYNPLYHFILNSIFLWDYQTLIALEKWKDESGKYLRNWLQAIGQIEALSSLAIIRHDHPDWGFPEIVDERYFFSSKEMGHPLLSNEDRVCNDLNFQGAGNILIITGSNMSGKSTLLRTVGINLVLAYAGSVVSAKEFKCSVMDIYSSMRVNDNLEKSISSFYAELLRIKMIIEASKKGKPMIFLLDEIFRGTNTKDRHIGAKTVLRNLSREGVMGLVSTHDLELGDLEMEKRLEMKNYHFRESYEEDKIIFDYKLRDGVSTTSNAIYLMKMVGIEI